MSEVIEIGSLRAKPGEKVCGTIEIVEHVDGYRFDYLPLAILNGLNPGKTLWLEAGFHGDEVSGIATAFQLIDDLNPEEMNGAIIVEPCVNIPSFLADWRYNPIDLGMKSFVAGNPTIPTYSERLGKIRNDIQKVLQKGDYFVSLHSPGPRWWSKTYIDDEFIYENPTSYEKEHLKFAEAIAAGSNAIIGGGPGKSVYDLEARVNAPRERSDLKESGIIKVVFETNYPSDHYRGIINALKYLHIIEGSPEPPEKKLIYCIGGARVMPRQRGLWIPKVKEGEIVSKGQVISIVRNLVGDILEEVKSPFKGVIIIQRPPGRIDPLNIDQTKYYGALVGQIE